MKTKILIGLVCVVALMAWTGIAGAQTVTPDLKMRLRSGEAVWDLSGDWEAFIENYGPQAGDGSYPNVFRITQTGSALSAIRLKDNPPPSVGRAGSPCLRGELDKNGFKRVELVAGRGVISPGKGQISEDGKKIVIDNGRDTRVTLTRP